MSERDRATLIERVRGALARALDPSASEPEAQSAIEVAFKWARKDKVRLPDVAAAVAAGTGTDVERLVAERVREEMNRYDARARLEWEEKLRRAIELAYVRGKQDAAAVAGTRFAAPALPHLEPSETTVDDLFGPDGQMSPPPGYPYPFRSRRRY